MVDKPEISILNLCYNTGERVVKTFESILLQNFKDFEVISIDDASSDNSFEIVGNWLRDNADFSYQHLKNDINIGMVNSFNRALSHANGNYIACIADDLWQPQFLETLYTILKSNDFNAGVVYSKANVYNVHQDKEVDILDPIKNAEYIKYPRATTLYKKIEDNKYLLEGSILQDHLFWINPLISFSFLGRYEYFANGYNSKYYMEDMPKWYELSKNTNFIYVDKVLATYVVHGKNATITRHLNITISVLRFLVDNFEEIRFEDTRRKVESRIAFMFINKEILVKDIIRQEIRQILLSFMLRNKASFINIVKIIVMEEGYKWKKHLFQ
jgi:glycosyltransferase involved in cell wall biosynthesis